MYNIEKLYQSQRSQLTEVRVPMCVYHGGGCHEMNPCNEREET